jgi:hypothetical protein
LTIAGCGRTINVSVHDSAASVRRVADRRPRAGPDTRRDGLLDKAGDCVAACERTFVGVVATIDGKATDARFQRDQAAVNETVK